jgi:hypothetical protein
MTHIRHHPHHGYQFQHGTEWRTLQDPHGPPTNQQLARLNRDGLLEIRTTPGQPLTKLDAAQAIDRATDQHHATDTPPNHTTT